MMKRASLVLLTASLFVSSSAFAQDDEDPPPLPPPASSGTAATPPASATVDAVHLRNGGLYRGRVTEIIPGDHVTIIVEGSGATQRVGWAEVDRVIVASASIPSAPKPGAAAPATAPLDAPMVGPRVRVHINTPKNVILYRRPAGSSAWTQACTSPCDQEMPLGDTYRITGNGVAASKEFQLAGSPGGVVSLGVDPPSTGGMVAGGFLAYGGAATAYVGLILALVGAAKTNNDDDSCGSSPMTMCPRRVDDAESLRNAGLITLAVGSAAMVGGILIFLSSGKTDVTQSVKGEASATASPPRALDAFLRQPTWKGQASSAERSAALPAAAFPVLFQGTF